MISKNHSTILFIDRNGFDIYQGALANIPKFSFTQDVVANLDVVSKEQLTNLIAAFVKANKIVPGSLVVVLSDNVIFVKDLAVSAQKTPPSQGPKEDLSNDNDHKDEVRNFLEDIPFEEILAKVIKTGNVDRAVAVNRDLVMSIIDVFKGDKFIVEAIVPGFIFGQNANFTAGLTLNNARIVLENAEALKLGNLLTDQEKMIFPQTFGGEPGKLQVNNGEKKRKNLRQYILIGVFVVLLIVLAVVYFYSTASQAPSQNTKIKSNSAGTVNTPTASVSKSPVIEPTLTQAPTATASVELKDIKIKIIQNSQVDEKAVNLKSALLGIGFQNVVSEVSEISIPAKSSVVFSQDIAVETRDILLAEVEKILPGISVLESQDSNFTIKISIGKS